MVVQRSILPGPLVLLGQPFEPFHKCLRERRGVFLVGRVAKIEAAAQGARLSGCAPPVRILPRARLARIEISHRPLRLFGQEDSFRRGQKERVAILVKPAAAARERAGGIQVGDSLVNVLVKPTKLDPDPSKTIRFVEVVVCLFQSH
jgi:hypothetical protein